MCCRPAPDALDEDGSRKANPLPEPVQDRPSRTHEYVFLFTKCSHHYFYDGDSIREPLALKASTTFGSGYRARGNDDLGKVKSDNWKRSLAIRKPRRTETGEIAGTNTKSVWWIASEPFAAAHYAVMPTKLVEPCVLAGTSPFACERCGTPWKHATQQTPMVRQPGPKAGKSGARCNDTPSLSDQRPPYLPSRAGERMFLPLFHSSVERR